MSFWYFLLIFIKLYGFNIFRNNRKVFFSIKAWELSFSLLGNIYIYMSNNDSSSNLKISSILKNTAIRYMPLTLNIYIYKFIVCAYNCKYNNIFIINVFSAIRNRCFNYNVFYLCINRCIQGNSKTCSSSHWQFFSFNFTSRYLRNYE